GDPLHHHLGWRDDEIARVTRLPVAWGAPDSGDAVVGQNAFVQLGPDQETERFEFHEPAFLARAVAAEPDSPESQRSTSANPKGQGAGAVSLHLLNTGPQSLELYH